MSEEQANVCLVDEATAKAQLRVDNQAYKKLSDNPTLFVGKQNLHEDRLHYGDFAIRHDRLQIEFCTEFLLLTISDFCVDLIRSKFLTSEQYD